MNINTKIWKMVTELENMVHDDNQPLSTELLYKVAYDDDENVWEDNVVELTDRLDILLPTDLKLLLDDETLYLKMIDKLDDETIYHTNLMKGYANVVTGHVMLQQINDFKYGF